MACGAVPVITNISANREWVRDGENGFFISTDDPSALAKKVIYLLENSDVRKLFAERCITQMSTREFRNEMAALISSYAALFK